MCSWLLPLGLSSAKKEPQELGWQRPAAFALALDFAFTLAWAFAFGAAVSKNRSQLLEHLFLEKPVLQILVLVQAEAKQA